MCGRTTSTMSRDLVAKMLQVDQVQTEELPARWNIAPTQPVYGAVTARSTQRQLRSLRWGLVPNWARDLRAGSRMINARAETLAQRPAYREALMTRRALLPFSGFYEWQKSGLDRAGPVQPFYFHCRGGEPLVFAGLWDTWCGAEGQKTETCTIITTPANKFMAPVHNRMPAILSPNDWDEWLLPGPLSAQRAEHLLAPAPEGLLVAYPVGLAVNDVRNDSPELVWAQQH
ncbi:MAG: SOS response-associated peptidase [Acidimicrobiales bacterium]